MKKMFITLRSSGGKKEQCYPLLDDVHFQAISSSFHASRISARDRIASLFKNKRL
jgi:hypothetical protein